MINIDEQKKKLLAEQRELVTDLNMIGIKSPNGSWMVIPDKGDGSRADAVDNADITEDFEEKIARLNILEIRHAQVQKALDAIASGTYGICEVSGENIPIERLLANPSATTMVEHA